MPATISLGSTGDDVKRLQRVLARHLQWNPFGPITGTFDASLETAVKSVQSALGLTVDGIFGPDTETAAKSLQTWAGHSADGVVGDDTWFIWLTPGSAQQLTLEGASQLTAGLL